MSDLCWLSEMQLSRLHPFFLKSHGLSSVDERRVLSGIIFIIHTDCCGAAHSAHMDHRKNFAIVGTLSALSAYSFRIIESLSSIICHWSDCYV